ncbi:MAG: ABC transporter substrate-binding protein [Chloroflexota bacterium]|nr:ABC transporter substrate-binding protein [Chloroflexota bacterium]
MPRQPISRRTAVKAGALGLAGAAGLARDQSLVRALAAQGAPGGRLAIGKILDLVGYDPQFDASQVSWEIHACVYESLVFLGDDFSLQPGLAESWEQTDDRTYVFAIRQGVTFHNGREMTADDVAFSLERVLTSPDSWWNVKMGYTLPQESAAATAVALGTPTAANIGVTVEATGPFEVTATLSEPYAPFLQSLTATTTSIVPGEEVRSGALDLSREMVGTGPFQVTEHIEDQRWILSRHDGYWQEGQPVVDEVVWMVITDEAARVASLRTGEIQVAMFDNPAMLDVLASDANVVTIDQPTTNYYILFVNATQPGLEDERVRQAISIGMDREQIKQTALFGRALATGPIAAAFSELATPLADLPFYSRDVERARQLLAEAGHEGGLRLPIIVTPGLPATVTMAEVLKAQLAEVGIELEILQRDFATFVNEYAIEGTSHLAISWWAGYSDPYLILLEVGTDVFGPLIGQTDTGIDTLIEAAARETDPEARRATLRQLEAAIATQGSFQPMVTRNNFMAYRQDQVGEVTVTTGDGYGLPLWHGLSRVSRAG